MGFQVKRNSEGDVCRYNAWLFAKGFAQKEGVDFSEIVWPTTWYDSIRIILAITAQNKYKIKQFDVKTAFLYMAF